MSTLGQIQKFQLHQDLKDEIDNKVIKETGKGLSTNDFTNEYKSKLDGLQNVDISGKVDKVEGKGLSTNDFTNEYKQKIDNTKTIELISQSDYDALSDSQKNDSTKIYAIY